MRLLVPTLCLLTAAACSDSTRPSDPSEQEPPPLPSALKVTPIVTGLSTPVFLTTPTGDSRLFVVEKGGRIRIIKNGAVVSTPFLDISSILSTDSERGLLGLAFHPQYATNGFFYVYFTDTTGTINVARYHVSSNPDVADAASRTTVITIPHPGQSNHDGGMLTFGPDGMLYFGTGDGGGGGDPNNNAQNKNVLLGKLIRIDVDHGSPYTIPSSNPFVGQANTKGEIWAYGLRNPWRFSFDRVSGNLYIGDVGESAYEEVDVVPATTGGLNYGWNVMEGMHCAGTCSSSFHAPVLEYTHDDGCAVTGGYVYRGHAIPGAVGTYFYSDFCSGFLRSFRWINGAVADAKDWNISGLGNVQSFGEDSAGELYILNAGGSVFRLDQ